MTRPVFVLGDDGEGEPTLWDGDQPVIRRADLPADVRHYWPELAARILRPPYPRKLTESEEVTP